MLPLFLAAGLALVHVGAGKLRFLAVIPRSRWLSFASGISVAYVFAHLLPEVAAGQRALAETGLGEAVVAEGHVWLLALVGLVAFYGLERAAKTSRERSRVSGDEDRVEGRVFAVHAGSFTLYNLLIGYLLLHREEAGLRSLLFFGAAMGLHFLTSDYGLRQDHKDLYDRIGRWLFASAVANSQRPIRS